jgi:5-hydroxyisourate hydrolase-like protein (transthyretin family)
VLDGLIGALRVKVNRQKQFRNKMSDSDGKLRAPTWDGTGDKSGQYLLKTKALAVYYGYIDTLEETTMATAPTKS